MLAFRQVRGVASGGHLPHQIPPMSPRTAITDLRTAVHFTQMLLLRLRRRTVLPYQSNFASDLKVRQNVDTFCNQDRRCASFRKYASTPVRLMCYAQYRATPGPKENPATPPGLCLFMRSMITC